MRPSLIYAALLFFFATIVLAGWYLGSAAEPHTGLPPPTTPPLPPTAVRAADNPIVVVPPTLPAGSTADPGLRRTPLVLPTMPPLAEEVDEPLPPLVFSRQGQIWRSDGSAAAPQQLTNFPSTVYAEQPSLAPDGSRIAFVALIQPAIDASVPLPRSVLYVLELAGGEPIPIWQPAEGILWLPAWSPDNQAIFLLANRTYSADSDADSLAKLQVVRFDLAAAEPLTIVSGALDPAISPDGSNLAYLQFDADGYTMHLDLAAADGSNPQRVIDGRSFLGFYAPRFSPDGEQIIVAAIEGPETDEQGYPIVYQNSDPLRVLRGMLEPRRAAAHGAPWDLWIVNVDGSGLRRLTFLYEDLPMAAFSPDGREIIMMAFGGFYRMDRDGGNLRRISDLGDHGGVDWIRSSE
ncbi:MAG TPA: hypothetical protein PKA05_12470 [Roseiflexaceae bacterium]|nr:hypothetical protein [Roseiflexaceae bacterium]HMP41190.1 hypothetical protein [Roseiflexaceae bacterium]